MQFVPEDLTDAALSEAAVWASLKEAFQDAEGVAYHRFPVYRPDGLYGYEADIVLVFREAGIYVIECKGYRIEHIDRIEGHRWHLRDWTYDVGRPVQQARDQMFALKNWLSSTPGLGDGAQLHHAVALPFVERSEWECAALDQAPVDGAVLLAGDLTPSALREWVSATRAAFPQSLTDMQWTMVTDRLGHSPAPSRDTATPSLCWYADQVPEADAVRTLIGEEASYTYVTATTSLEARRRKEGFGMNHQVGEGPDRVARAQLAFPKMMRSIMKANLFTRADERVLLWRAARAVAASDPDAARRLKHDVFAWRDAIAWLEERDYDLSRTDDMDKVRGQIVHPRVAELLAALQQEYRRQQHLKDPEKTVFEVAARRFLAEDFRPTDCVVLEGFSRFTPLQQYFIQRSMKLGARVILLFPWRSEQDRAFRAIRSTFEEYANRDDAGRTTNLRFIETPSFDASHADLHHVQHNLFADDADTLDAADRDHSVSITPYDHINTEAAKTVEQAVAYVDDEGLSCNDIVIVTPHPSEYASLLLEEAERRGKADYFHIPPRKLLLTPPGRFVLTLYEVWNAEEGRLDMAPDQFETLLASGWLGGPLQRTTGDLEMVHAQAFDRCSTLDNWASALDRLEELRRSLPETSRLPAAGVHPDSIRRWRKALNRIESMCRILFDGTERTIGEHVERLLDQLTEISERTVFESERRIIQAIKDEMEALAGSGSVEMETAEFGDILNSLLRRREQEEDEQEEDPTRISIRSPSGVDRASKQVVFMIGMDGGSMPGAPSAPWPIYAFQRDDHYDQQRYLFLAGVRAAEKQLHVSYAKVANARKQQPSPFVRAMAQFLGEHLDTGVQADRVLEPPSDYAARDLGEARRDDYTLDEIAHFKLCPHRYKMERLDGNARRYKPMWQVRFLAQGHWINKVLEEARNQDQQLRGQDAVASHLLDLMDNVEGEVKDAFPGLRPLDWRAVRYRVEKKLQNVVRDDRLTTFPKAVDALSPGDCTSLDIVDRDRTYSVQTTIPHVIHHGRYDYPFSDDYTNREWLLPHPKPENRGADDEEWTVVRRSKTNGNDIPIYHTEKNGLHVFSSKYDAVQWWAWAHEAVFYATATRRNRNGFTRAWHADYDRLVGSGNQPGHLAAVIEEMEKGRYPKNPGKHCHFCSLKGECLGLDP